MTSVRDRPFFTPLIHPGVNPYPTLKPGVLTAALSIESDHYLSEVLKAVGVAYPMDNATRPAYERAVDAIGSDHYRGKLLVALRRSATDR